MSKWMKDMLERAVSTAAEVTLGIIGAGLVTDLDLEHSAAVVGTAVLVSVLKSILARGVGDHASASLVPSVGN